MPSKQAAALLPARQEMKRQGEFSMKRLMIWLRAFMRFTYFIRNDYSGRGSLLGEPLRLARPKIRRM